MRGMNTTTTSGRPKASRGQIVFPGVITHASNIVEHPELIAERIIRFANLVGRENVIASATADFRLKPFKPEVHQP